MRTWHFRDRDPRTLLPMHSNARKTTPISWISCVYHVISPSDMNVTSIKTVKFVKISKAKIWIGAVFERSRHTEGSQVAFYKCITTQVGTCVPKWGEASLPRTWLMVRFQTGPPSPLSLLCLVNYNRSPGGWSADLVATANQCIEHNRMRTSLRWIEVDGVAQPRRVVNADHFTPYPLINKRKFMQYSN